MNTCLRLCVLVLFFGAFCSAKPIWAACEFNKWLVDAFHHAELLETQFGSASFGNSARKLSRVLEKFPQREMKNRIRRAGLAHEAAEIMAFTRMGRDIAASSQMGRAHPINRQQMHAMRQVVAHMECVEDPNWAPAPNSLTLGKTEPQRARNPGQDPPVSSTARAQPNRHPLTVSLNVAGIFGLLAFAAWLGNRITTRRRRRARRHICNLPCQIWSAGAHHTGRIADISQLGAKLQIENAQQIAQSLVIQTYGMRIPAKIIWQGEHYSGVLFQQRMSMKNLNELLRYNQS